ncbi:hypothetical protein E2I00_003291, partial [Balaenoptera physalus]
RTDSEVQRDGRILDLIDDARREDKLPYEDVAIPLNELPEPEQDNGGTTESVKEQEMKRTDSEVQRDGRILDLIDDARREDKLPYE